MKRLFWTMLPFVLCCAGLMALSQRLDEARRARLATRAAAADDPRTPPPAEPSEALPDGVEVGEIHTDPMEVVARLDARGLGSVSGLVSRLNNGEITPLQAVSNLVLNLNDSSVQPVDAAVLGRVLPRQVAGWTRGAVKSGPAGGLFMKTASAEVSFLDATRRRVEIKVMDTGSMKAIADLAQDLAGTADMVQSNAAGMVRTSLFRGHPLFEKFAEGRRKASAHLFVGGRFIIQVESRGAGLVELRGFVEALDLAPLTAPAEAP